MQPPTARDLTAIAAVVQCDVRTVRAYFEGRRVLPIYASAIERAWSRALAGEPLIVAVTRGESAGDDATRRMA